MAGTDRPEDVDAETLISVLAAMRRHEIGVAVGAMVPPLLGIVLLYLGGEVGLAVPPALLAGVFALSLVTGPLVLWSSRRAFIAECVSLGLSPALAKRLFLKLTHAQARFEAPKGWRSKASAAERQEVRDRERAALMLTP